jgi:hypothetical protein
VVIVVTNGLNLMMLSRCPAVAGPARTRMISPRRRAEALRPLAALAAGSTRIRIQPGSPARTVTLTVTGSTVLRLASARPVPRGRSPQQSARVPR